MSAIQGLIMEGFTIPEIAKELNASPERMANEYKPIKKDFKYLDFKQTPDKEDERLSADSFSFDGVYTWDNLCQNEIDAYYEYEQKNHAFYV